MLFVLVMFLKCATCSVVCEICQHPGRPPDYIKGQIGCFVLHKLYTGADLTIFVRQGYSLHGIQVFQTQESSTL